MPHRCCVLMCRGNYDASGPKVAVFGFPRDTDLRNQWLQFIKRDRFVPTKASKVCELHFQPNFIEKKTTFRNETTGDVLEAPLKIPRLVKGAIPTLMNGCPFYMSQDDIDLIRVSPAEKRLKIACRDVEREAFNKLAELDSGWVKALLWVKGKQNICSFLIDESQDDLSSNSSLSVRQLIRRLCPQGL